MVNGRTIGVKGGRAMNEKFFSLPKERKDLIRNSAMLEFGESTFQKTSADAIAKRAGVSKGLLFHYFKDKRELYLYLYDYALKVCLRKFFAQIYALAETDFFALLELGHQTKMEMVRRHPGLFRFVMRTYYERDSVLTPKLRQGLDDLMEQATEEFIRRVDVWKFKEGADPRQVIRLLTLMSEGMLARTGASTAQEIEALYQEYLAYADMLRRHLYKEEYV